MVLISQLKIQNIKHLNFFQVRLYSEKTAKQYKIQKSKVRLGNQHSANNVNLNENLNKKLTIIFEIIFGTIQNLEKLRNSQELFIAENVKGFKSK